jgi:flagellar basal-body rod modification protein FlgD
MSVSNTSAASSSTLGAIGTNTTGLVSDTQNQFLTLLVTQLRNQDPLNPMDNAEVTSQIAQLSTVNGINQLNSTLLALSGQMDVSQSMQAAGLIGKTVLVPGNKISLGTDATDPTRKQATAFGVDLVSDASQVTVTILDGSGKAVRQMKLGHQSAGVLSLAWDGTGDGGAALPDGAYTFQVGAVQLGASAADATQVAANALSSGTVDNVSYGSAGVKVDLGLAGSAALSDVKQIM